MAGQVSAGSPPVIIEAPSTLSVTSEPTERSKPPETITNTWPDGEDRERRGPAQEIHEAGRLDVGVLLERHGREQHDEDHDADVDAPRETGDRRGRAGDLGQRDGHATCPWLRAE